MARVHHTISDYHSCLKLNVTQKYIDPGTEDCFHLLNHTNAVEAHKNVCAPHGHLAVVLTQSLITELVKALLFVSAFHLIDISERR